MADVAQLVVNGLLVGSIFALGGVGLTLVYGILKLVNFAHGDLLTTGAYAAWIVAAAAFAVADWQLLGSLALVLGILLAWNLAAPSSRLQHADHLLIGAGAAVAALLALWVYLTSPPRGVLIAAGLITSAVFAALLSVGLELTLWRKLRRDRANLLTLMIVSIGLAFVLRSLLQMVFGGELRVFFQRTREPDLVGVELLDAVGLGTVRITPIDAWIFASAVAAGLVTYLVLNHTRTGKAMRALSDDLDLARVAGIDTDRVVLHVWVLGGALAGLAGALLAMFTSLHVNLGWFNLLSIFAAVILGGVGSVPGVIIGGLTIGVAQELSILIIPSGYKLAVGFAILILALLVRPQGIMGVEQA